MPIKKETIEKTGVCYFSRADNCYIVESPLFPRTAGIGASVDEAWQHYREMLAPIYEELIAGNVLGYNKQGRPAKGGVDLHTQVKPRVKKAILDLSKKLGVSIGDAIEYLWFFYDMNRINIVVPPPEVATLKSISDRLSAVENYLKKARIVPADGKR